MASAPAPPHTITVNGMADVQQLPTRNASGRLVYAAATAAAYAKELLLVIPGQGIMNLSSIEQSPLSPYFGFVLVLWFRSF